MAGALNSVAGGGGFIAFPALVFFGVPPVSANATNTLALWPASVGAAVAYLPEFKRGETRRLLWPMLAISVLGGFGGAWLLIHTPEELFEKLVPFLLLFGTLVFTFGKQLIERLPRGGVPLPIALLLYAAIALYGGYFGGGMGFMMLALFTVLNVGDIHAMNALKCVLVGVANAVALGAFVVNGIVAWTPGLLMTGFALLGGYFGARLARKIPPERVRRAVVAASWVMTVALFIRAWS